MRAALIVIAVVFPFSFSATGAYAASDGIKRLVGTTQMKSQNANDAAMDGADKQRKLIGQQKSLRASQNKLDEKLRDKPRKADVGRMKSDTASVIGESKREILQKKVKQEQERVKKLQGELAKANDRSGFNKFTGGLFGDDSGRGDAKGALKGSAADMKKSQQTTPINRGTQFPTAASKLDSTARISRDPCVNCRK